jgi:hypothetical protein
VRADPSPLDLRTEEARLTLPHARCIFTPTHPDHTIDAPNGAPILYCSGQGAPTHTWTGEKVPV